MLLIRSKHEVREFQPENVKKVLLHLKDEHQEFYEEDPNLSEFWPRMNAIWQVIENEIQKQIDGKVIGSSESIPSLRLVESLAAHFDPCISLSAILLDKAVVAGLLKNQDLERVIEDWFIQNYNRVPYFLPCRYPNYACLHFPGLHERVVRGYPSPRKVERDWSQLTNGYEMYEFQTLREGNLLYFSFSLIGYDRPPGEPPSEFHRVGLELIGYARGAPV